MHAEQDYVLGTHNEEIERLALQHRVWRRHALAVWQRAGIRAGQTVVDLGCGPGYAALDLAEIVGASGRVIAIDRSERFLAWLGREQERRQLSQLQIVRRDIEEDLKLDTRADLVWCRWAVAFVRQPRRVLAGAAQLLRPGGAMVFHEYADYRTWRMMPPCAELEMFVDRVMHAWRTEGGEPDIGRWLPAWLADLDMDVRPVRLLVEAPTPANLMWEWPRAFVYSATRRLEAVGYLDAQEATRIRQSFEAAADQPGTCMVTPLVAEIIAHKRG